jgi:hypothetical protein
MTHTSPAELPEVPGAYHMGDLARAGVTWKVYLEILAGVLPVKGRVHFVTSTGQRSTGWVFIEMSETDLMQRFQQFSALELWRLLESLA